MPALRTAVRRPVTSTPALPRFQTKWVNGIWTIFDRINFTNCEPCLGTQKNAERLLNAPAR